MTNLLPGEKIYHVLGHVLGMCLTISIVSCGGNQQSNFKPEKNKTDSSAYSTCDKVNDTIYLNFHSNMKQEDFDKEISKNPKIEQGKVIYYYKDKYKVPFDIIPNFNECLTAIRLECQVQFGNSKIEDDEESNFITYFKNLIEEKYGPFKLKGDSSYTERKVNNDDCINTPYWVQKYSYPIWGLQSLLKSPNVKPLPRSSDSLKSDIIINEVVENLTSASYELYENKNKDIEIIYVTSNYKYRGKVASPAVPTSRVYIQINYYSKRYWSLNKERIIQSNKKKSMEILKSDSLFKANKDKL